MKRRLFNILAAVLLVLCVATVVLWMRSYSGPDLFLKSYPEASGGMVAWRFGAERGCIKAYRSQHDQPPSEGSTVWFHHRLSRDTYGALGRTESFGLGFGLGTYDFESGTGVGVSVPYWFIMVLFLMLPAFYTARFFRRRPLGSCQVCNYNLTGNTSGICPECGTAIPRDPSKESATA